MSKQIYLIHFSKPIHHAKHYLGWTSLGIHNRLLRHHLGNGSALTKAVVQNGGELIVVRVWDGTRHDERRMKKWKNIKKWCPFCRAEKKGFDMGEYLSVKRHTKAQTRAAYLPRLSCKWCGNTERKRYYYYNGSGPFCDKECYTTYHGAWPQAWWGDIRVEYCGALK